MTTFTEVPVDLNDALDALRSAAWQEPARGCDHCDHVCQPAGPWMIHTYGAFGCDVSLEAAVDRVFTADRIVWGWHLLRHNLIAYSEDGRHVAFGVEAPSAVKALWQETQR